MPWGRKWQPTPVFLPVKSHGQRSLAGYWSHLQRLKLQLLEVLQDLMQMNIRQESFVQLHPLKVSLVPPPLHPGSSLREESLPGPSRPPGPLPAGTPHLVIGWRRGSLARACGCSYKNPRVPALSFSRSPQPSPTPRGRRPERSGRGHSREACHYLLGT